MCLEKRHKWPKFTIFPKRVAKVLTRNNGFYAGLGENDFISPFQLTPITYNKPIKAKDSLIKGIRNSCIFGEGVHAYRHAGYIGTFGMKSHNYIFEAAIPPFTFYWESIRWGEIAARRLIVFKELWDYNCPIIMTKKQRLLWYIEMRWGKLLWKLRHKIQQ